jgi:hypothetical protein
MARNTTRNIAVTAPDWTIAPSLSYLWASYRGAGIGDLDGDGLEDPWALEGEGGLFLFLWDDGPLGPPGAYSTSSARHRADLVGGAPYPSASVDCVTHGDIDGDGLLDVIVAKASFAWIWFGATIAAAPPGVLPPADVTISGGTLGSEVGDVDGDGFDDVALRFPGEVGAGMALGRPGGEIAILPGSVLQLGGAFTVSAQSIRLLGPPGWGLGVSANLGSDLNGDGINDPILGFEYASSTTYAPGGLRIEVGREP